MDEPGTPFALTLQLRWADLDPNGHVRHSVYYDWGAMVRVSYLERQEVGLPWMTRNAIGPVLFREEARFLRELRMGDEVRMDVRLSAASADARKWRMRHQIHRGADLMATLDLDGAWLDLKARKIVVPPPEMVQAFANLARTEDFAALPSKAPG